MVATKIYFKSFKFQLQMNFGLHIFLFWTTQFIVWLDTDFSLLNHTRGRDVRYKIKRLNEYGGEGEIR